MPFDTNIYGKLDMNTPIQLSQLLDPANIEKRRAGRMATEDDIIDMQDKRTIRDLLRNSPDIATAAQKLGSLGMYEQAGKLQNVINQNATAQRGQQEAARKQALEQANFAAYANPTDEAMSAVFAAQGMSPEMTQGFLASVTDPEQRKMIVGMSPQKWAEVTAASKKQEEAKAADLARQRERDAFTTSRDTERYNQQNKIQRQQFGQTMAAINARGAQGSSGKPPAGFRYTANGDLEAIPGGPSDLKRVQAEEKARIGGQKVIEAADMATSVIDQLISEPGLKYITGAYSLAPIVPSTSQAKADALAKQVEGQAFLQAFQSLKGAGAITDIEGKKATAAIARLSRSQSQKDYTDALNELKQVATSAKQKASGVSAPAPSGAIKFLGFE